MRKSLAHGCLAAALGLAMLVAALSSSAGAAPDVPANTFTVNLTNDAPDSDLNDSVCDVLPGTPGPQCTLRAAIEQANARSGADVIAFNLSGSGVQTITPGNALPVVTDELDIDGYTQPGSSPNTLAVGNNAVLRVRINGAAAPGIGIVLSASNSSARGLILNGFAGGPAIAASSAAHVTIAGNFIGTDASGAAPAANHTGVLLANAPDAVVGGATPADRNLISGNLNDGVLVQSSGAANARIVGNYIGTNAAGSAALGNGGYGVHVNMAGQVMIGVPGNGNVISANDDAGVYVAANYQATGVKVQGNYIGTDATGTAALGAQDSGVFVYHTEDTLIGGTVPGAGNLISGNGGAGINYHQCTGGTVQGNRIGTDANGAVAVANQGAGISLFNSLRIDVGGTTAAARNLVSGNANTGILIHINSEQHNILGNYIGTNLAGTAAIPNEFAGIMLTRAYSLNIGGTAAGAGNLISGNHGMGIFFEELSNATVQRNLIGTTADGGGPLPNTNYGIGALEGSYSIIGGTIGAGNTIAYNGAAGVLVVQNTERMLITSNSIHSNNGLGIELGPTGPTPNDPGDADEGANELQNYPLLSATSTRTVLRGSLSSKPATTYLVELYANNACDPSGYGEGQTFLGAVNVTTLSNGYNTFEFSPVNPVPDGAFVTATATDAANNTSEFSPCQQVADPTPTPTNTPPSTPTPYPTYTPQPTYTPAPTQTPLPTYTPVSSSTPGGTQTPPPSSTPTRTFTAAPSQTPGTPTSTATPCPLPFGDVQPADYFYGPVQYLYCRGAISGYADNTFRPYNSTTRSQMVKIVVLAEGFPLVAGGQTFSDVPASDPFHPYIETAAAREIVSGYGDGSFRPYNPVTRGQLCKMVIVAEGWALLDPPDPTFVDVLPGSPFYEYIETAHARGVVSGYDDGRFRWDSNATRGQIAKIVFLAVVQ